MAKSTSKEANVNFKINGADQSKQDINGIRNAVESLGDEGAKAAQPLVDIFENIQRSSDRVTQKISDGAKIGTRDGAAMLQQFALLKQQLDDTFGGLQNAPPEIQKAFAKAEGQVDSTTAKIRTGALATKQLGEELKAGGVAWDGFGGALTKVAGSYGGLVIAAGAAFAALKEGWSVGTTIAKAMGADVDLTSKALDNFATSAGTVFKALATDGLSAAIEQAVFHFKNLDDTINGNGDALKNLNIVVDAGISRLDALKLSQEDLTKIALAHNLAIMGGVEGLKLFNQTLSTTDPKDLAEALTKLSGRFVELAKANEEATKASEELKKAHEALKSSIDGMIQKIQDEIIARRDGGQAVLDEVDKYSILKRVLEENRKLSAIQETDLGGVTLSMRKLIEEMSVLLPKHDQYIDRIKNANDGLKQLIAQNESLTPEEKKRVITIQEQIDKYKDLAPADKFFLDQKIQEVIQLTAAKAAAEAHKQGLDGLIKSTDEAGAAQNKLTVQWVDGKAQITSAGVAIEKTKTHISGLGQASKDVVPKIEDYNKMLDVLDQHQLQAARSAEALASALARVGVAAAQAAGAQLAAPSANPASAPPSSDNPNGSTLFDNFTGGA